MTDQHSDLCTAFLGHDILHSGTRLEVALAAKQATAADNSRQILVFDDRTGRVVDLDLRGSDAEIARRLTQPAPGPRGRFRPQPDDTPQEPGKPRGRGRPKLGVVAREVTLLPRHWDWLAKQKGGASATLRRLVDEARRRPNPEMQQRAAREAAYTFLHAIAGDLPGYEDAMRALFAGDLSAFENQMASWPRDIRSHATRLASGSTSAPPSGRDGPQ